MIDDNDADDDDDVDDDAGVPVEHTELGLEARRWHCLLGGAETWLHRTELSGTGILNPDGEPVHYALVQDGNTSSVLRRITRSSVTAVCLLVMRWDWW